MNNIHGKWILQDHHLDHYWDLLDLLNNGNYSLRGLCKKTAKLVTAITLPRKNCKTRMRLLVLFPVVENDL